MSRAQGRDRGRELHQLFTAIDSLCNDPAWIVIIETIGRDAEILVKRQRLASLLKRYREF